ncbi:MAG: MMPL family transporter [Desulfobacterales bacterium]|nr:MMPL family transporter [Desulfobacterales bacterium]MCP4159929.1 MMPL family transporter [Deltaproteobacteria bacterium]
MKAKVITDFSMKYPKRVTALMIVITLIMASLMVMIKVDTDPENMLSEDEAVRVFHNKVKKEFTLHDMVVVGVVNDKHKNGIFNVESLKKIHELTAFAAGLQDKKNEQKRVLSEYIIAPSNVDTIAQAGQGQVRFDWLMKKTPKTEEQALKIKAMALSNPLLKGTMVAEDGKAIAIYLPVSEKDFSYEVRERLLERIEKFEGDDDKFYITGLPVAEDTFGVEMFIQMAVSAPLAMLAIFILMLLFFKSIKLIISPMIIAVVTVIVTMGLLIGTGNTVHIMTSMIPIFLMPIAVVDSVHIISEFYDRYDKKLGKVKTIVKVMEHLFKPMLFTSLTSSAGFISLVITPIPPVQTFGLFVSFGIMLAWFLTILFIPAYIMFLDEDKISKIKRDDSEHKDTLMNRFLKRVSFFTYDRAKLIISAGLILSTIAVYGITKIEINDNPVKWFKKSHSIRVSDKVLNSHFGGTYGSYLILEGKKDSLSLKEISNMVLKQVNDVELKKAIDAPLTKALNSSKSEGEFFTKLEKEIETIADDASDDDYDRLMSVIDVTGSIKNRSEIFKKPDYLNYLATLQKHLASIEVVGKSNSLADVVKKVYMELFEGKKEYYKIPDTKNGVTQTLISFQNSHKPDDLFHFVTPKYDKAAVWVQLNNGDNKYMEEVVKSVAAFIKDNPPPSELKVGWAGLTFLNTVWQEKMVNGMVNSFLGSFIVVFLMMAFLFRSPVWGLLAMIPLSITILLIYGVIGFIGKDYDMPIAVLSSLTLGLAVDFAIHFIERIRETYQEKGDLKETFKDLFEEPARAITRNIIVIAIGFTPLLFAPLVPYQTVGVFLASIMLISGIATVILIPSIVKTLRNIFFRYNKSAV